MPAIALLVDFDGVIRRWSADDARIERHCGLPTGAIRRVAFSPKLLFPAITGAVSDEAWRQGAAAELQKQYPGSSASEAVTQWSSSTGEVDSEVLAILSRCRPGLRLILATNATTRLASDLRSLELSQYFHALANSSELKAAKPSAEYFRAALSIAGVQADEALFVDDTRSNVEAAAAVGILGHHFTGHEALSRFLGEAGAFSEDAL